MSYLNFNTGLFVKYPFALNKSLSLFPLLGAEYNGCFSANENGQLLKNSDYFSSIWFKLGGGLDVALAGKVYLRVEALYGLRLETEIEEQLKDTLKQAFTYANVETLPGHGLTARLAIGYRF
jgi:hypothetical protein